MTSNSDPVLSQRGHRALIPQGICSPVQGHWTASASETGHAWRRAGSPDAVGAPWKQTGKIEGRAAGAVQHPPERPVADLLCMARGTRIWSRDCGWPL